MARIVITGASSGIGASAATLLASRGHDVIATVRTQQAADALTEGAVGATGTLRVEMLEVTNTAAVTSFVDDLVADAPVDTFINNAGVGSIGTLEDISFDDLRYAMEVNFFAVAAATKAVLPSMRRAGRGQIVCVTSVGGIVGQPFNEAYCAAKFAVEGLYECLRPLAQSHGVYAVVVEPGPVATQFVANVKGLDAFVHDNPSDPYLSQRRAYFSRTSEVFASAQDPLEVAEVLDQIVNDTTPKFRYQTSTWASAFCGLKISDLDGSAVTNMTSSWFA